jgi:hypothetical protein
MRCAKSRTVIEDQIRNGVADLSLNEAAAMLMLSSDVRKLLEMAKTMEGLQGEELITFCVENDIGVLTGNIFNAPEPTDQETVEWLVFVLWLVKQGWYVEGAFHHMDWVQSRGTLLKEWMGPHPIIDKWRKPLSQQCIDHWNAFLEINRARSADDVSRELNEVAKVQGPMPPPRSTRTRKRRRAAATSSG